MTRSVPQEAVEFDRAMERLANPDGVDSEDIDRAVTAVFQTLDSLPWKPKGLPGEIATLRALVGIILAQHHRRRTVPYEIAQTMSDRDLLGWLANEHPEWFFRLQAMADDTPTAQVTPENVPPDGGKVTDRHGTVWTIVRDGGMAEKPDPYAESGVISIGIEHLRKNHGPLLPWEG